MSSGETTEVYPAEGTPFHLAIPVHNMTLSRKVSWLGFLSGPRPYHFLQM